MSLPKLNETLEQARDRARADYAPSPYSTSDRVPQNNGELAGYRPASALVEEESQVQGSNVKSSRSKEVRSRLVSTAKTGGAILALAGATVAAVKFGHDHIAHQQAPWQNRPTQSQPNHQP